MSGGVLEDLPGVQVIIDAEGVEYPSRKKAKFFGVSVADNPVLGQTELTFVFGPQSNALYVDAGTSLTLAQQSGSYLAPFATFTAAIAAAADSDRTIYLAAGDYSAEAPVTWASSTKRLALICPSGAADGRGFAPGAQLNALSGYSAKLPTFTVSDANSHLRVLGCSWSAKSLTAPSAHLEYCYFAGASGTLTVDSLGINRCYIARPIVSSVQVQASLCTFDATGTIISGAITLVEALACRFPAAAITINFTGSAGTFRVDSISNFYWKAATETLTNGTKTIIGDLTA